MAVKLLNYLLVSLRYYAVCTREDKLLVNYFEILKNN